MNNGYIPVWREEFESDLWKRKSLWRVFMALCYLVDHRTGDWQGGRRQLAEFVGMKERTVYDALLQLQLREFINIKTNNKFSVIHICNSKYYQLPSNNKTNNKPTTNQHYNKELKQLNNNHNIVELLEILNRLTERNFRVLPKTATKTCQLFSLEEIQIALTRLAGDAWHKERLGELSSDYLLRSSTIDRFLSATETKKGWST